MQFRIPGYEARQQILAGGLERDDEFHKVT
jgi:hypothetical protein